MPNAMIQRTLWNVVQSLGLAGLLVGAGGAAHAQERSPETASSGAVVPVTPEPSTMVVRPGLGRPNKMQGFALGFERNPLPGGGGVNGLHAMYEFMPDVFVGLGLGFGRDFESMQVGPDLRYFLFRRGSSGLFVRTQLSWFQREPTNAGRLRGYGMGFLLGFHQALSDALAVSLGYGLHFAFGKDVGELLGARNSDFIGNLAVHWYF
jgi:hypothetical protein